METTAEKWNFSSVTPLVEPASLTTTLLQTDGVNLNLSLL